MEIILTAWALDSYLELKHKGVFDKAEYEQKIRPDVLLLERFPNDSKFKNNKFWSPATDRSGQIADGFKMKWHNVGNGRVQLRLPVGILGEAYLCAAYVKVGSAQEKRMIAKFKVCLELIRRGRYSQCGRIS